MQWLKGFLLLALLGYGALMAYLYVAQRSLMYFPETRRTAPQDAGLPQAEEIVLSSSDGERLIVWHVPPHGDKPVVLYFHGNGGALRYRAARFAAFVRNGLGLVALSYRGYGGSTGSPSEDGIRRDAAAAYAFTAERYSPARIAVFGESLGSGVAVPLAAEHPVAKLVLQSPFTSTAAVAAQRYPFVPVRLFMHDQFRSDAHIAGVRAPVLVLHGARDRIIPITFGEELFAMVRAPKRFIRFAEGGHNDLDRFGALDAALSFIEGDPQ